MNGKIRFEPPPLYFMHIPKTAGTSLRSFFKAHYLASQVMEIQMIEPPHGFPADISSPRYRCYMGHYGPGLYRMINRPEIPVFTMLRDPVERAVSMIHFHRKLVMRRRDVYSDEYIETITAYKDADIKTCLELPNMVSMVRDFQTRDLGSTVDWAKLAREDRLHLKMYPNITSEFIAPEVTPQVFANATRELDNMIFVGMTEYFSESSPHKQNHLLILFDLQFLPCRFPIHRVKHIGVDKVFDHIGLAGGEVWQIWINLFYMSGLIFADKNQMFGQCQGYTIQRMAILICVERIILASGKIVHGDEQGKPTRGCKMDLGIPLTKKMYMDDIGVDFIEHPTIAGHL